MKGSVGTNTVPRLYIKTIAMLEDFINESLLKEKESKKKMNATQARALNTMKQKIKKNNRLYEVDIENWRAVGKKKILKFSQHKIIYQVNQKNLLI